MTNDEYTGLVSMEAHRVMVAAGLEREAALRASNQALREALEALEWDDKSDPYDSRCSQCLAYSMNGHEPDCTIRAALAADARREGLDTAQGKESRDDVRL